MQISRHLLITCAVAACLTPTFTHAYDNEAQIRARQALDEQMKQAQTPPATSAPPVTVSKPPVKVKVTTTAPATSSAADDKLTEALRQKMSEVPAPPANPPIVVTKPEPKPAPVKVEVTPAPPVMSAPTASNPADDKLTEALRQKMSEVPAEPVSPPAVVIQPAPKPAKVKVVKTPTPPPQTPPPVVIVTPQSTTVQATPAFAPEISQPATPAPIVTSQSMSAPAVSNPADARLSDALHQKMHEETEPMVTPVPPPQNVEKPKYVNPAPVVVSPAPTHPVITPVPAPAADYAPIPDTAHTVTVLPSTPGLTPTMSLPTLSGPPSPLSATKQQRLDSLLQQYRMDQLTPQQYHEQRAKILAEP